VAAVDSKRFLSAIYIFIDYFLSLATFFSKKIFIILTKIEQEFMIKVNKVYYILNFAVCFNILFKIFEFLVNIMHIFLFL